MARNKIQISRPKDINKVHYSDLFETPPYAIVPELLTWVSTEWTVWEPAAGSGRIKRVLEDKGYEVIATDLSTGQNFFDYEPEHWDVIITNPPYSIKFPWIEHCYELGKPFALLVPLETIGSSRAQKILKEKGFDMILLNSRVDFHTPRLGWKGTGSQFPCIWLTYNLLDWGYPIIFSDIKEEKAKFRAMLRNGLIDQELALDRTEKV